MSEKLKFLGFTDSWKKGEDAYITGFGSVPEGATVDVPDDLVDFLLTSNRWERSDEDLTPRFDESAPEPTAQPPLVPDSFVGALTDGAGAIATTGPDAGAALVTGEATTKEGNE